MLKKIEDFPDYFVSDEGCVYSMKHKKIKKLSINRHRCGYSLVGLCCFGVVKKCSVHRLVANAFIPNPKGFCDVNHKNGIKSDNRVCNLEWVTRSMNIKHSFDVLHRVRVWKCKFGKDNPSSKPVLQIKDGRIVSQYCSLREAADCNHIDYSNMSKCCLGKQKTAGGFQWKYKE